ncbi:MAG TPA: ATP-binding protein [Candidatus Acidoferrales bacterium]|nr:ATP-binding protein [Candidatus Acidoferrales bacterium]
MSTDSLIRNQIAERNRPAFSWLDGLWLIFLAGLAVLPPVNEVHKQLILLAIGLVQVGEGWLLARLPARGPAYIVILKIGLASLLIAHTGEVAINSRYYLIYYLPVLTAAVYFGVWGTLGWIALTSAAYCSFLIPALQEYTLEPDDATELALRILFFFIVGVLVNRLVIEVRLQTLRYQRTAEALAETNRQLESAQEEARRSERLAALGHMAAGLAHEIRNPLGVIKGSAEMLSQKVAGTNPLASELAGYISSEVNRLSLFVTRFLDFARPQQIKLVPHSIPELLDKSLTVVAERYAGSPVRVVRAFAPGLPAAFVDAELCESAFVNLIQNAYEAMGDSAGELRVEAVENEREGRKGIEVRISDRGPGIPEPQREEIFNPFITTKKSGTGLGLSIVSKIVDAHHGSIRVEEMQGGGATFILFLPLEPAAQDPAGKTKP